MFTFGYAHTPPYITYRVISKDGYMHDPVPITVSDPIMMHDFAITENYAIFLDLPLIFRPKVFQVFLFLYSGKSLYSRLEASFLYGGRVVSRMV